MQHSPAAESRGRGEGGGGGQQGGGLGGALAYVTSSCSSGNRRYDELSIFTRRHKYVGRMEARPCFYVFTTHCFCLGWGVWGGGGVRVAMPCCRLHHCSRFAVSALQSILIAWQTKDLFLI